MCTNVALILPEVYATAYSNHSPPTHIQKIITGLHAIGTTTGKDRD